MKDAPGSPQGSFHPISRYADRPIQCSVRESESLRLTQHEHYHDYYQIYYVSRGSLTHCINGISFRLMAGDSFIVPPFTTHKIEIDAQNSSFISFSFYEQFLPDFVRSQPAVNELFSALHSSLLLVRIVLKPQDLMRLEQCMKLAVDEFKRAEAGYECVLQGQLSTILIILSRAYNYGRQIKHDDMLLNCLEYINANYSSNITAKEISDMMFLSASTFYRYFKQVIGRSFKDYLTMVRIRNACNFLRDMKIPLSLVAYKCGYSNYSVFYRAFFQEMQVSPTSYRKSFQQSDAADAPSDVHSP